jgi:hypothetical protein
LMRDPPWQLTDAFHPRSLFRPTEPLPQSHLCRPPIRAESRLARADSQGVSQAVIILDLLLVVAAFTLAKEACTALRGAYWSWQSDGSDAGALYRRGMTMLVAVAACAGFAVRDLASLREAPTPSALRPAPVSAKTLRPAFRGTVVRPHHRKRRGHTPRR